MSCYLITDLVLGKYEFLGKVYELQDYKTPSPELLAHLRGIIDEAFGRSESENV